MRQGRSSGRPDYFEDKMKVKFTGNPLSPQDNRGFIMWAGERFDLNVPRDLPEGKAFAKIPQNGHFAVVGDDDAPNAEPSPADEKAELVAFAEKHGVKIDKRWSVAKITAAIEDAAAAANEE
jgi:hypothetical protein